MPGFLIVDRLRWPLLGQKTFFDILGGFLLGLILGAFLAVLIFLVKRSEKQQCFLVCCLLLF